MNAPEELETACRDFTEKIPVQGLQMAMLTPILNSLAPDRFLIVNSKPRQVINYFLETKHGDQLTDYAEINADGWRLIEEIRPCWRSTRCRL